MNPEKEIPVTLIEKYLSGASSESENKQLYDWLTASEENMQEFTRLKQQWDDMMLSIEEPIPVKNDYELIKEKVLKLERRKMIRSALVVAASLAIICSLTFIRLWDNSRNEEEQSVLITTSRGELQQITLPDQTVVWLNSESRLSYFSEEINSPREVFLTGEACFDVAKDPERPFIVRTAYMNIRVLGTRFNVTAYDDTDVVETMTIEGRVSVSVANTEDAPVEMVKNDRATLVKGEQTITLDQVDAALYSRWTEGLLCFKEETLTAIAKKLERRFNLTISLKDQELCDYIFTATFEKEKDIEDILDVFCHTSPIEYVKNGNHIELMLK
ncbi:MAG: FecR family protein [Mangrovibacterium sp.]